MNAKELLSQGEAMSVDAEEARIHEAYAKRQTVDGRYSWFNAGHLFMMQDREQRLLALLRRHGCVPLETKKILEIGCGTGFWLREFIKWGAHPGHLTGVELLPDRVAHAKQVCPEAVTIECGSAARLPYPSAAFDVVLQSTVFTSILDARMKQQIAAEMLRVLKSDGLIVWYDYHVSNPRNPDVRGVPKREIVRLFPHCEVRLQRVTLAPPLVRVLAPYAWGICELLTKIPLLCTHYLGVIQKGASRAHTLSPISSS